MYNFNLPEARQVLLEVELKQRYCVSPCTVPFDLSACSRVVISLLICQITLHCPLLLALSLLVNVGAAFLQTSFRAPLHSYYRVSLQRRVIIISHIVKVHFVRNLHLQCDILQLFCFLTMALWWSIWCCYLTKLCTWYYVNQNRFHLDIQLDNLVNETGWFIITSSKE